MKKNCKWIAMFSQTGSEIVNLSKTLGVLPDLIVTNRTNLIGINLDLLENKDLRERLVFLPAKPVKEDYDKAFSLLGDTTDLMVTLHGWLRIIPASTCIKYKIYNSHPGLITRFPELKGYNPQERAYQGYLEGKYKCGGSVIHECTPELDGGKILISKEISFLAISSLDDMYYALHDCSFDLWCTFFNIMFNNGDY